MRMIHPETGGVAHVTEDAFTYVYAPLGWELLEGLAPGEEVLIVDAPVSSEPVQPTVSLVKVDAGVAVFSDGAAFEWSEDGAAVDVPESYAEVLLEQGGFVVEGDPVPEPPAEPDAAPEPDGDG